MARLTTTGSAEFVTPRRGTAVLQNGVNLARSAEEVFDYLSDLRNEKEWNPKMQLVEAMTDGPTSRRVQGPRQMAGLAGDHRGVHHLRAA